MRAPVILIAVVFAGCPPVDECAGESADRAQPFLEPVSLTGTPTKFTMSLACTRGVTSVTSIATDSKGNVAPSQVLSFTANGGAVVELTATSPGPHTIVAHFEPSGQETRRVTHVLRDRSAEPPLMTFSSQQRCFDVRAVGNVAACNSDVMLELYRDGRPVETRPQRSRIFSSGGTLWSIDFDGVHRWAPTDAGLNDSHLLMSTGLVLGNLWAVTPDELILGLSGGSLFSVHAVDGGLVNTPLNYELDPQMSAGLVVTDGGVLWLTFGQTCFAAPAQPKRCRDWGLRFLEPERDGFWFRDEVLNEVGFAQFVNGPAPNSLQSLRIEAGAQLALPFFGFGYPNTTFQDHLVAIDSAALRLDAWKGPRAWDAGGVNIEQVWFGAGKQFVVYRR